MLFQTYPFRDNDDIKRYTDGGLRFPSNSASRVSDSCKDLFNRIFTVDPSKRITCEGILDHTWVRDYASLPDDDFGEEYKTSLRTWILRRKFKESVSCKVQRCNMIKSMFLDRILGEHATTFQISNDKFHQLQREFLKTVEHDGTTSISLTRGLNLEEFCYIFNSNGLPKFGTEEVFHIFDLDDGGSVDYFEFLSVLAPYREDLIGGDVNEHTCRLYFDMFDHDMSGEISREEFHAAVTQILVDYKDLSVDDVDSVFNTIDINRNGEISLAEFRAFFEQMTRSISSAMPSLTEAPSDSLGSVVDSFSGVDLA